MFLWCSVAVVSNSRRYQKEGFPSNKIKWLDSEQPSACCAPRCHPQSRDFWKCASQEALYFAQHWHSYCQCYLMVVFQEEGSN